MSTRDYADDCMKVSSADFPCWGEICHCISCCQTDGLENDLLKLKSQLIEN